ncbi:RluA family pseudouridine synthase [Paenibacillus kandeliae]|uniref:RluA family pseudouridine synthase n=1 Tax=Paenibacillus kandeliae TaxID=3231269 RepID=UPI0034585B4B
MKSRSSSSKQGSGSRSKQNKPHSKASSFASMNGRKGNAADKKGNTASESSYNARKSGSESKIESSGSHTVGSKRHGMAGKKQPTRRRNDDAAQISGPHSASTPNRYAGSKGKTKKSVQPSQTDRSTERQDNLRELPNGSFPQHAEHDDHIEASESTSSHAISRSVSVPVLYEDNHVIGVVKPVNIPSQADDTGDEDMLTLIKQDLKERHQKAGNVFLGLVHRLDRPVGGAMLFAKTSKGASRLSDSVRNGQLLKRYVAVLRGIPSRPKATLRDTLLKNARTNTSAVVSPGTLGGKDAVLDYEVLATHTQSNLSLVLITLHTGRSHQIRVQMSHAGYPLYGDQRYGVNVNRPGEQLALWSVLAGAPHPVKDEMIRILSLPPRVRPWNSWADSLYKQLSGRLEREQD